jgi:hypothetical protein
MGLGDRKHVCPLPGYLVLGLIGRSEKKCHSEVRGDFALRVEA